MFRELFTQFDYNNICGFTNELKSIYLNSFYNNNSNSILVVCNSLYEATKMYNSLKNYFEDVLFFPMDDFITSEVLAISPDFKISRLETLHYLKANSKSIVVTNLMGYLRLLPKKDVFNNKYINLVKNTDYKIDNLIEQLYEIGYMRETVVNKSGEVALRGFVVDIFPIHEENPIRIEFWGDTIDSIRKFDINSQLTLNELNEISIMPNTEVIDTCECSIKDYLENVVTFFDDYNNIKIAYSNLEKEIKEYCVENKIDVEKKFVNDLFSLCNQMEINMCMFDNNIDKNSSLIVNSYPNSDDFSNITNSKKILDSYCKKYKYVIICLSNRYQANKIIDTFTDEMCILTDEYNLISGKVNIIIKNISEGFFYNEYVVISESEIFCKKEKQTYYKTNFKCGTRIKDITKLIAGDYIVHNIHGIGRYCGIKTITKNRLVKDYLQIEYRGGDKLYIPVEKIDMISKYSSSEGYQPKVNKLGTNEWEKAKYKAQIRAHDIADELLKLYALREMKEGFAFPNDDKNQMAFEKEFPFVETVDQLKVIEEIKLDMQQPHPMDRLLCADVGYGKTEVAFRAAFKAILAGKQVALLCPTTILSNQHYQNAIERFNSFPIEIRMLNRFVSPKQVSKTISDIKAGKVDLVIGTHKLLNDEIEYKDLGLLIIDEEQRFGVTHKEKIKRHKENVDVLTLSATPIPRTLQMSMSGLRGLSLIETPPSNRYPVQTYVLSYNQKIIKDAIYKELSRQGQIFILYNYVDSIESKFREISLIVPDARITFAHGRMSRQQLEDVMYSFINHEFDVLICTTIIETGIDIPNVNTLIVIDADRLGLSQLYQLRGRVGRTNKLAYCYLMYDQRKILSEIATKRLNAIKEFTELGSGLSIAMRDLSIRGAGDILGSEQAGFVDSVGIELFTKMLKEEIDKLKGIIKIEEPETSQPLVEVDTYVDSTYVEEEDLKIEIHKKINEIDSYNKLLEVKEQLEDRFGKLSDKLIVYMYEEWFEHLANKLKVKKVNQNELNVELVLSKELTKKIDGEKLFIKTLEISREFRFKQQLGCLIITLPYKNLTRHFIYYLIDLLLVIEKAI